jgi:RHS repeat-associated protein
MSRGHRSVSFLGSCVIASLAVVGCSRNEPSAPATTTVVSALNASPKTSDFVIEAQNSVRLQTGGMVVNGGDIGARGTSGPFLADSAAVDALTGVQVQTTHNIIAASVNLGTGAHVGDVQTSHLVTGTGATHGGVSALVPLPALPAAATVSPGSANLTVATGATTTASPGHFATISVGTGSTLKLAAGAYDMTTLSLSTGAKLQALGAVQIHVAGKVSSSTGAIIGAASGVTLTAAGIRIEVSGQNGSTGALTATPAAASFGTGNNITALILVPNGTLAFGTGAIAKGAFMGRDVDLGGAGATITYQDGFSSGTCTAQSCDDGNPCTVDTCGTNGTCTHASAANGTSCNDSNACTTGETCQSGTCGGGTTVTCTGADTCHTVAACVPATGCPAPVAKANGTTCSDNNACTSGETCQAGACTGGSVVTCSGADTCHTVAACVPATGCPAPVAKANGTTCSDNNACTSGETCQAGACTGGSVVTCSGADQCHTVAACVPATGCPAPVAKTNGTTCSDNNACTSGETCQAGACTGGSVVTCSGADQCHTVAACVPAMGCPAPVAKANGTTCTDNNACTSGETCQAGACTGGSVVTCSGADQCHTVAACVPATGCPAPVAKANGTTCSDNNACTSGETCQAGSCTGGTTVTCTADQCHTAGACVPATGCPATVPKPDGTGCSDGDSCTQTDTCQSGTCAGANPVTCVAADSCHDVGVCAAGTGICSNPQKPTGSSCGPGLTCTADGHCQTSGNLAPVVNAGPNQTASELLGAPPPTFTLQRISTGFNSPVGIGYYQPTNQMMMSVNCCAGEPHNFDLIDGQGNHQQYSNINGLSDEVYFDIARDEGGGRSRGGFLEGEMLVGTGSPGTIARVSSDGSTIEDPWVVLPGEAGLLRGQLFLDRTGLYGGDLMVTTTAGNLWRVTSAGDATRIPATLQGGFLEGLATVPDDPVKYGPWAGKILIGDENVDAIEAVDPQGNTTTTQLGIRPEDIMVVPANENFFGVDYFGGAVWGASASQFTGLVGEILIAEENGGALWHVRWNGTSFDKTLLAQVNLWEHTTFGPGGISEVGAAGVSAPLNGTATDDGLPTGSTLSVSWTVVSGPGPVSFSNSQSATTTATFNQPGTYVLRLTATDGQLTSSSDTTVIVQSVNPANQPPTANAGSDQTITLPAIAHLTGSAADDGLPAGSSVTTSWSQVSGPGTVTFVNSISAITDALFSMAGTYVLQLTASDGALTGTAQVTITVNPAPSLAGANLAVSLSSPGPLATGATETLNALLTDSGGHPINNALIQVAVTGANPTSGTVTTAANGRASFTYLGTNAGTDHLQATAISGVMVLSASPLTVVWSANGGTVVTQGWIGAPLHQATVMGQVPVALSGAVTLVSGTVSYWPAASPTAVHVIDTNAHGTPGTTIATLDTTTLANGSYILDLNGVDNQGNHQDNEIAVTVAGDYKPGRLVVEMTDLTIPLVGLPITVGRRYDSLQKDDVGDFGNGWSLIFGHPDLQVDPAHNVTLTMPDGRRVTFYFTPTSYPFPFQYLFQPTYTPEAGVFGRLTSDGCPLLVPDAGRIDCFEDASTEYVPTTYTYTDAYGVVYTMGAGGDLKSIHDRNNNTLSFSPGGIVSSAGGLAVTFTRDDQGRITKIVTPQIDSSGATNEYGYTYDGDGNLTEVQLPPNSGPVALNYTYDGSDHRLLTAVDANGHPARTSTYDGDGRLATDMDAMSNLTTYVYDLAGHTTTTTNPDLGVVTQTFDDRGLVLSETDPLGRRTSHVYDSGRNEIKRTNALGEVTSYAYDTLGNQISSTNALGETTQTTYNDFSEPTTTTNPIGNTTTFVYEPGGLPGSFTDNLGVLATFTSSASGLPLSITDASDNTAYLTYDFFGNVTSRTDRLTRTTHFGYDGLGHKTSAIDPRGGVASYAYLPDGKLSAILDRAGLSESYGYDANGNKTSKVDAFGPRSTLYAYDADNHLVQIRQADGTTINYTRDFRGNMLSATDENSRTTSYAYDLAGQLVQTTYPDGIVTTQGFDDLGRLTSQIDGRGNTTTYSYLPGCDCTDRMTTVTDPLGRTTTTTYDAIGRRTSTTDAAGHQTFYAYDPRGHLIQTDYVDGSATRDTYDAVGRRVASTDQAGATTTYAHDAEGQLVSMADPLGNVTQYSYDPNGNLAAVTDANKHVTTYAYDADNRRTRRTLPLGMTETFSYDLLGNKSNHSDFQGKTTTYTYDLLNRLTTKVPDPTLAEPTVSYSYNANGTRGQMTDASGTTTYAYDVRDRLISKAAPAGTLTYSYDASGNVASIHSSNTNGTSVGYSWDAANQLASLTDAYLRGSTTEAHTATGRPSSVVQANGVSATYAYDPLNRVTSLAWQGRNAMALASWTYTHNGRGQRLSATDLTGREAAYDYDAASRLTNETITGDQHGPAANGALTYSLDSVGNRLSRSTTLAALGPQSMSYDANDRLTSDTYDTNGNTTASAGTNYFYDFENRLLSKNGAAVTVVYDGDGNRVAKTANGVVTQYLVDDLNPTGHLQVLEEISGGAVQRRYTYGNAPVSQTRDPNGAASTSFYGYDVHGNVTFLTDLSGVVTDTYDYDAWGLLVHADGTTPNTRLYAGEEFDPDLGLINLRARSYQPGIGRFLTPDPPIHKSGSSRSANRYLYASGDPVNRIDPRGTEDLVFDAIAIGVGVEVIAEVEVEVLYIYEEEFIETVGQVEKIPIDALIRESNECAGAAEALQKGCDAWFSVPALKKACYLGATAFFFLCIGFQVNGLSGGLPGIGPG